MALNADLPFATPEEYFLDQPATPYSLKGWDSKTHDHGRESISKQLGCATCNAATSFSGPSLGALLTKELNF